MSQNLHSAIFSVKDLKNLQKKKQIEKFAPILEIQDFIDGLVSLKNYAIDNKLKDCYVDYEFFHTMPIFEHPKNFWFFQKQIKSTYEDYCNGYVLVDLSTINYNIQYYQEEVEKMLKEEMEIHWRNSTSNPNNTNYLLSFILLIILLGVMYAVNLGFRSINL